MNLHGLAVVWEERAMMLNGLLATVEIALISLALASMLGVLIFAGLISRRRVLVRALSAFVDLMRCVPFMLFCYLIYYALPDLGVRLDNFSAGVLALTLYNAAYFAELLRGAWSALPRETIEAGAAFGFHGAGLILRVILPQVLLAAAPMLGNQTIQIIKDSAFLIIIAVKELTYAANEIQATYYVPFASFLCAVLFYWLLCLAVEGGVRLTVRRAEGTR